jgi:hypothetical protein
MCPLALIHFPFTLTCRAIKYFCQRFTLACAAPLPPLVAHSPVPAPVSLLPLARIRATAIVPACLLACRRLL